MVIVRASPIMETLTGIMIAGLNLLFWNFNDETRIRY